MKKAFDEARECEARWSRFVEDSELNLWNRMGVGESLLCSPESAALLRLALDLQESSRGAFQIFKEPVAFALKEQTLTKKKQASLDIAGLAKGWIVDQVADYLQNLNLVGSVNAGGDLKNFGGGDGEAFPVDLRLGSYERPFVRSFRNSYRALATSSMGVALGDPKSTTSYSQKLRKDLQASASFVVCAGTCAIADGLTKVAMFAPAETVQVCAEKFSAQILVFDGDGEMIENYGPV